MFSSTPDVIEPVEISEKAAPQFVKELTLINFRSYDYLRLQSDANPQIITGHNGAGKTNILEAISLLQPGKGLRHAALREMDRTNNTSEVTSWGVSTKIESSNGVLELSTGRDPSYLTSERRIIKINGKLERKQQKLLEHVSIVYLSPLMDGLFVGGTTERRAYLNRITTLLFPEVGEMLLEYDHAKAERLKLLSLPRPDVTWLNVLEEKMAHAGVALSAFRIEIETILNHSVKKLSYLFPQSIIEIDGVLENHLKNHSATNTETLYKDMLEESREKDRYAGRTTARGPHRSDLVVWFTSEKGTSIKRAEQCSTGEQKALLLSLTLASALAKSEQNGVIPIILLDEVVAHLDASRRHGLASAIIDLKSQCWMTGTDPAFFQDFRGKSAFLTVENSKVFG